MALPNLVLTNPTMYFPLGNLYLAAMAKMAGFSVEIVDMRAGEKKLPPARFYGFSCTTPEIQAAKKLARKVKGKTIVGGAHPTLLPDDCLKDFDYVVRGEGEYALIDILKGNQHTQLRNADRILNLDLLPYPAWDMVEHPFSEELFPGERYGKGQKAMTVLCSRGCPFSCSFCGNAMRIPVIYRSVPNIIGELVALKLRGVGHIRFEDDNFTNHPEFIRLCIELGEMDIKWKCHTRSQLVKPTQMELMKAAGCEEVGVGVESADDRVLAINNKKETRDDHARAVRIIHQAGLRAKTYMIAGLPGETDNTFKANQEFFKEVKPDKWTLATFTPYPGCDVYNSPEKYGITIIDTNFNHWWNFTEGHFVHKLNNESQGKTWLRYERLYQWLVKEEWKC